MGTDYPAVYLYLIQWIEYNMRIYNICFSIKNCRIATWPITLSLIPWQISRWIWSNCVSSSLRHAGNVTNIAMSHALTGMAMKKSIIRRVPFEVIDGVVYLRYSHIYCNQIDKTVANKDEYRVDSCRSGSFCKFAHTRREVIYHPIRYKKEKCKYGDKCTSLYCASWHSEAEREKWDNYREKHFAKASANHKIGLDVSNIVWEYLTNIIRIIVDIPVLYAQNSDYETKYKPMFDVFLAANTALEYPLNALHMTSFISDPQYHNFMRDKRFNALNGYFVRFEQELLRHKGNSSLFASRVLFDPHDRNPAVSKNDIMNVIDMANKILEIYDHLIFGGNYILSKQRKSSMCTTPMFIGDRLSFEEATNSVVVINTDPFANAEQKE